MDLNFLGKSPNTGKKAPEKAFDMKQDIFFES